ncbi:MAG: hypothetical protein LUD81_09350, partial [Clostridiales bacterium]|nr:hypothetical protein [Clostridiales bacterium]
ETGTLLLACDENGNLYIWNTETGEQVFTIDGVVSAGFLTNEDKLFIATQDGAIAFSLNSASVDWSILFSDDVNSLAITNTYLSEDKSTLAIIGFDSFKHTDISAAFIDTETGGVKYVSSYNLSEKSSSGYFIDEGDFYDGSKFILGCYYAANLNYSEGIPEKTNEYKAKFIYYDINRGNTSLIPYESDLCPCGISFCREDSFAFEGYKENPDGTIGFTNILKGVYISGSEKFNTELEDIEKYRTGISSELNCFQTAENEFLVLNSDSGIAFFNADSGKFYNGKKYDSEIKNVYAIREGGFVKAVKVLCTDGIKTQNIDTFYSPSAFDILSLDDEPAQASNLFVWGGDDRYCVVGSDKCSIITYCSAAGENFKNLDVSDLDINLSADSFEMNFSSDGKYILIRDGSYRAGTLRLNFYDSYTKKKISSIPYFGFCRFYGDCAAVIEYNDSNTESFIKIYNILTGEPLKTYKKEDFPEYAFSSFDVSNVKISGDEKVMIISDGCSFYKIGDTIEKIPVSGDFYATEWRLNTDGSRIIAEILETDDYYGSRKLCVIDTETGALTTVIDEEPGYLDMIVTTDDYNNCDIVFDSSNLAALRTDDGVIIFSTGSGKIIQTAEVDGTVEKMLFTDNGKSLIVFTKSYIIYKYDVN